MEHPHAALLKSLPLVLLCYVHVIFSATLPQK